jgi:hypothetical protein
MRYVKLLISHRPSLYQYQSTESSHSSQLAKISGARGSLAIRYHAARTSKVNKIRVYSVRLQDL